MNSLFIHGFISSQLAQAICRTLLHSVWQGLLGATISGIIILSTRKTRAAVRYNLLSVMFVCFILGSVITFLSQLNVAAVPMIGKVAGLSPDSNIVASINGDNWLPAFHKDKFYQPVIYYADRYASLITGVWLFFFFLQMVRMSTGLHYANRLIRRQVINPAEEWQERLQRLKESLGIRRIVSLMESGIVKVPIVVGVLKPVVLVPLGMLTRLSPTQVETVLLHELAHVRRRDFAMNILQRVAESFFFFNPFIMWLSARIREEREACCDDIVMEHINDKRSYLEALISFRQPEIQSYGHAVALGQKNNLLYRVKRMITQENKKLNAMEKLTLIFVLVAVAAISFMPARKENEKKNKEVAVQREPQQPDSIQYAEKNAPKKSAPAKIMHDTLPEKQRVTFKNISSTINDDGTIKKAEVTAKGSDGKTYYYRLENNDIKELRVDDINVKEADYDRYKGIIDEIEQAREKTLQKTLLQQKQDIALLQERQELMNQKLFQMQNEQLIDLKKQQDIILEKQKLSDLDNAKLLQDKLLLQKENNLSLLKLKEDNPELLFKKLALQDLQLQKLKEQQNASELLEYKKQLRVNDMALNQLKIKRELLSAQDEQFHDSNYQLAAILAELAEAGVIADKNNFSFTLNNDELIVDGKRQSAKLHESLRTKFIKHKKDYYKYKAKPNSRSTDVYVE